MTPATAPNPTPPTCPQCVGFGFVPCRCGAFMADGPCCERCHETGGTLPCPDCSEVQCPECTAFRAPDECCAYCDGALP